MSSNRRKKRGIQDISEAPPAEANPDIAMAPAASTLAPAAPPLLLKDVLPHIVQFSPGHLRLRLLSSEWNQAVIQAHCDPAHVCQKCSCTSSLRQFDLKRLLLPWITTWKFAAEYETSQTLLSAMLYRQQSPGGPLVSRVPCSDRRFPRIAKCSIEIWEDDVRDADPVFLSPQMHHLKELEIRSLAEDLSDESRKQFIAALAKLTQLESLEIASLNFDSVGNNSQQDFHRLIEPFPNLKVCIVLSCNLAQGLSVFASSAAVSGLEKLHIINNHRQIPAAIIRDSIASSPFLTNLRDLNVSRSRLGNDGVVAICQSTSLIHLKSLDFSWCELTDASVNAMTASARMKDIESLNITGNDISAAGFASLLLSASKPDPPFSRLQDLQVDQVRGSEFKQEVASSFYPLLGDAPQLPQRQHNLKLTIGSLYDQEQQRVFDDSGVASLAKIPLMEYVSHLDIYCSTDTAPCHIFSPSSCFTALKILSIGAPEITWTALADLAKSPLVDEVHTLAFHALQPDTQHLDDRCCKILANSAHLRKLKTLKLSNPRLSVSVGLIRLLSSPNLLSLTHLECYGGVAVEESMTVAEAADHITQLLTTKAKRIRYLRFPDGAFARSVRGRVKRRVPSIDIE